jgi:hypothetical protein
MQLEISEKKGERIWGCSTHVVDRFIQKNRFLKNSDYRTALFTLLKMMNKATLVCYDLDQDSDIYTYGSWIMVCKESTIVTVYPKKGSKWAHLIY